MLATGLLSSGVAFFHVYSSNSLQSGLILKYEVDMGRYSITETIINRTMCIIISDVEWNALSKIW